jgi:phosphoadenosine phosphosulfate reductase
MQDRNRTFSPGKSELFWCQSCNLPLLAERCSTCHSLGQRVFLSPPGDVRLCSAIGRERLKDLFLCKYGYADLLDGRIILLNKIAGIDRRDQVILDGRHIATLWFDVTTGSFNLDLESAGAALLADRAIRGIAKCRETMLKGHIKGKWLSLEHIESQPEGLSEGDNIVLKIGKYAGVGVVRRRKDGSAAIRIKDVTKNDFQLKSRLPTLKDAIRANEEHLKALERAAQKELKSYLSRTRLPVNLSFSGGKDSLATLCLSRKLLPGIEVLFINTGLEFPETVEYVQKLCSTQRLKLHEIQSTSNFFEQVQSFGPPAKDFRWCCKTNKLGPMTSFLERHYPRGCVTIEGRRIYESFNRSTIKAVERNPYVPNQTTLSPIRDWRALEVMLYIHWNKMQPNPLYEQDLERIGCWLCPASLQSEFSGLQASHPDLYAKWTGILMDWARKRSLDKRYVKWGFWRWKRHPAKMLEIAKEHGIDLEPCLKEGEEPVSMQVARGRSPCGLEYSIEANLCAPQNHPFSAVAAGLSMIGEVKYNPELGAATVKSDLGRATIFASGHIMIIAGKEKAEELLGRISETILRVQLCTKCRICMKNCSRDAIHVEDTFVIDEKRCNRCGKCARGCIAADRARKILKQLL